MESKLAEIENLEDKLQVLRRELKSEMNNKIGSFFPISVLSEIQWKIHDTYRSDITFVGYIPYEISKTIRKLKCYLDYASPRFTVDGIAGWFEIDVREDDIYACFDWDELKQLLESKAFILLGLKRYLKEKLLAFDDRIEILDEGRQSLVDGKETILSILRMLE